MGTRQFQNKWKNQTALITGASSGIGALAAEKLAENGIRVLLVARRENRLQDLAAKIRTLGGQAEYFAADLSSSADRNALLEWCRQMVGTPDILINNAGIGWYGYFSHMPLELAEQLLQINVESVVFLTKTYLPAMLERGSGHIINVSSIVGGLPNQGVAMYSASKAFVDAFTTSIYREIKNSGVHISSLRPGPVTTEFYETALRAPKGGAIPAERFAIPAKQVVNALWSLLNHPRRVVFVPGFLILSPWLEILFGRLIDCLGPLLLRKTGTTHSSS